MKARLQDIVMNLRQPWLMCVLCIAVIPIFPEFISPLLAGGALWAALRDAKIHRRTLSVGALGKILLLYMAYMAFGVLYSANPFNSIATLMMWVVMFLVYVSMTTVLTNRHRFNTALFCIAAVAGFVGFIACLQYGLGRLGVDISMQFWGWIDRVVYEWFPMPLNLSDFGLRASSTFNNPNILAEYLVMVLPFVIYYSFSGKRTWVRMFCRCCLLAALGGIAFSFSRGSYLALLCMVAVLCIANIRKITVFLMSAVSMMVLIPSSVLERLFSVVGTDGSISQRWQIWGIGLQGIAEAPLFGYGPGVQNSWDLLIAGGVDAPHMHNLVLELLVEGGLIALAIFLVLGYKMLRSSIHLAMNADSKSLGIALVCFVVAFSMHGMVDFPLLSPKLVSSFMMVIGFSDCACHLYMDQKTEGLSALLPSALLRRRRAVGDGVAFYSKTK